VNVKFHLLFQASPNLRSRDGSAYSIAASAQRAARREFSEAFPEAAPEPRVSSRVDLSSNHAVHLQVSQARFPLAKSPFPCYIQNIWRPHLPLADGVHRASIHAQTNGREMPHEHNDYAASLNPIGREIDYESHVELCNQIDPPPHDVAQSRRVATWRERPDLMFMFGGLLPASGAVVDHSTPFGFY
jgi:hypothetical protein